MGLFFLVSEDNRMIEKSKIDSQKGTMKMKSLEIGSIQELLDTIDDFKKDEVCWFRGQSDESYKLQPGVLRKGEVFLRESAAGYIYKPEPVDYSDNSGDRVIYFQIHYLNQFIKFLQEYDQENNYADFNILDFACLGQHYKLKTGLLDWSTDGSVALFFSCSYAPKISSAFFVLKPHVWNKLATGSEHIFNTDGLLRYDKSKQFQIPVALESKNSSTRICRQSGYFTAHGSMIWPLEEYCSTDDALLKIVIPSEVKIKINSALKTFGITEESIYVGSSDYREEISEKVEEGMKSVKERAINERIKLWENTPPEKRQEKNL